MRVAGGGEGQEVGSGTGQRRAVAATAGGSGTGQRGGVAAARRAGGGLGRSRAGAGDGWVSPLQRVCFIHPYLPVCEKTKMPLAGHIIYRRPQQYCSWRIGVTWRPSSYLALLQAL